MGAWQTMLSINVLQLGYWYITLAAALLDEIPVWMNAKTRLTEKWLIAVGWLRICCRLFEEEDPHFLTTDEGAAVHLQPHSCLQPCAAIDRIANTGWPKVSGDLHWPTSCCKASKGFRWSNWAAGKLKYQPTGLRHISQMCRQKIVHKVLGKQGWQFCWWTRFCGQWFWCFTALPILL